MSKLLITGGTGKTGKRLVAMDVMIAHGAKTASSKTPPPLRGRRRAHSRRLSRAMPKCGTVGGQG